MMVRILYHRRWRRESPIDLNMYNMVDKEKQANEKDLFGIHYVEKPIDRAIHAVHEVSCCSSPLTRALILVSTFTM